MKSILRSKARKRNLYELFYKQPENRVTESFIKMLEKTKPNITSELLALLGLGKYNSEFKYGLQVNHYITANNSNSVILGISEFYHDFNPSELELGDEKEGKPDAYIYANDDSIHILVEVKVGNNKLTNAQLLGHSTRFVGVDKDNIRVVNKTWDDIRTELSAILKDYDEYHRNYLLIQEFIDLITPKGYYDIYHYPEHEHLRDEYLYFDTFIKNLPEVTADKSKYDESIDYFYKGTKFVSIFPKRNILILKPNDKEMQRIVNTILDFEHFTELELTDERLNHRRGSKEGIIDLNRKDDLSLIKDLILVTYNVRKAKGK
ncbi:hypothetical protein MHZ92_18475 [Sporosarcina sp. ACRSL]|uniref:hypothetical protein n=1 Tax=Sporosarcina sp. ACRSL TaxID=2918215 RepID=UPI001EF5D9DD|nr:hypothetical protein [Sporosarcina sp. ACRSL]MCG7346100.1 hypothetical protein [Sporosarcina sp. ACRSL]